MKKFFKIFAIVIVVILAAMVVVPYLFKDKILEFALVEANKTLNAKVEIGDISLSMFKEFPDLSVNIEEIIVSGTGDFKNDTLAYIGSIGAGVNLKSIIGGDVIETKDIYLRNANFNAVINKNGKTNWDIVKTGKDKEEVVEEKKEVSASPEVLFESIHLENIYVGFFDKKQDMHFTSENINIKVNGNFSEKNTNINFTMSTPNTNLLFGGIKYLDKAKIGIDAQLAANLDQQVFKFKKNKFTLNQLELSMDGSVDMNKDDILMDLKLKTNNNDFKTLLSMVPNEFKKSLKDVKTKGKVQLSAYAKGRMTDKILPAFGAILAVEQAQIQYPALPESIDNINILAKVNNPGGVMDNTVVNVSKFHLDIAKNPIDFKVSVKNPISDAELKGDILAKIDFNNLKKAIPLKDVKISGLVDANISFDGKKSYIDKEQYSLFKTSGKMTLKNFIYEGKEVPKAVHITRSVLKFSSKEISLQSFDAKIGQSDLSLKGKIQNYIPYVIEGKTLLADFTVSSKMLNINELMPQSGKKEDPKKKEVQQKPLSVVKIPNNLDLKLRCNIGKMLYDNLIISNTKGLVTVKDSKAKLNGLNMNLLKGKVNVNGEYNAKDIKLPKINFKLGVHDIDLNSTYNSFSIIKEMIPMALNCSGRISMDMNIKSNLNQTMEIIPTSLNGKGDISSEKILINKNKLLDGLAKLAKDESLKKVSISKLKMDIVIVNGNLTVKPFNVDIAGNKSTIFGTQSVTGGINYTIQSAVDKKLLGNDINRTFNNIPGYKSLKKIDVDIKIGGTLSKPTVKPDLQRAQKQIAKAAKKEFEKKAKGNAKKLIDEQLKKHLDKDTQKKAQDLLNKFF
ncbi:MAG: AsmA-like C-terminal region-containing protein [Marinifilaceae bacterium]